MSFLERLDDPLLRDLYRYWDRCRGETVAPARRDIDPAAIPRLLPYLMLTEVDEAAPGARRYRYRLAGTEIERSFGCAMTGRWIHELMQEPYRSYVLALYERLVELRRPLYSQSIYGRLGLASRTGLLTKRLMLPLSSDGKRIDMVLSGQTFHQRNSFGSPATVVTAQTDFDPDLQV